MATRTDFRIFRDNRPMKAVPSATNNINNNNNITDRPALRNVSNICVREDVKEKKGKVLKRSKSELKLHMRVEEGQKCKTNNMRTSKGPQLPPNIKDIDITDSENHTLCSEYAKDIYSYLRKRERRLTPSDYMEHQTEITVQMRTILINWLIQVHSKFELLQETLYLTVYIIDRYLQTDQVVPKFQLQLIGVTSMLMASKYEEIFAPELGDFAYITDNAYSTSNIKTMEQKMMKELAYDFSNPLCLQFLRRFSRAGDMTGEKHTLAKYFMELTLISYTFVTKYPSQIAAAALFLSIKVIDSSCDWTPSLQYYTAYKEEDILPVVRTLAVLVLEQDSSRFDAVRVKYALNKLVGSRYLLGRRREVVRYYSALI